MIENLLKSLRLWRLRRAIGVIESAGLAVVNVKRADGAVYLIGRSGSYVRFDKVKSQVKGRAA